MNRKLLIISLLFPFLLSAQSEKMGIRSFFVAASPVYTTLRKPINVAGFTQKNTAQFGRSFGIGFQYSFGDNWALMVEANASSVSYEINETREFISSGVTFKSSALKKIQKNYIDIPITFLSYPTENKRIYLGAGFGISILNKIKFDIIETGTGFNNQLTSLDEAVGISTEAMFFSIKALAGCKISINSNTSFRVEPFIFLRENDDGTLVSSFGISSGLHQISYGISFVLSREK